MRKNGLSQNETAAKYQVPRSWVQSWEHIYREEGPEGLYMERRGRGGKGRPNLLSIWTTTTGAKAKGLTACDSQTASPFGCLINIFVLFLGVTSCSLARSF